MGENDCGNNLTFGIFRLLEERLNGLEARLRKQIEGNSQLLEKYRYLAANAEEQHVQQVQQADNIVSKESGGVDNKDKEEERPDEEEGPEKNEDEEIIPEKDEPGQGKPNQVIPILLFACNR